jgi:hypothetical protein
MVEMLKREWWVIAACLIGGALYFAYSADTHVLDAINAVVLGGFWFVVIVAGIRAAYLPIQYISYRRVLKRIEREEADLQRRAAAGDAVARVSLSMAVSRDPRRLKWWQW